MDSVGALERCAYCREYVPVTIRDVRPVEANAITARVAVCESCFADGR